MKAGLALLLLIIGGFLIYEVLIGNGPAIIGGLRQPGKAGGGGGDFGDTSTGKPGGGGGDFGNSHPGTQPGTVGRS